MEEWYFRVELMLPNDPFTITAAVSGKDESKHQLGRPRQLFITEACA